MIRPSGYDKVALDQVNSYNNRIIRWWGLIAFNEKSKLAALQSRFALRHIFGIEAMCLFLTMKVNLTPTTNRAATQITMSHTAHSEYLSL